MIELNEKMLMHLNIPIEMNIKYAILPGDPGRVDKIAQYIDSPHFLAQNREFKSFVGKINNEDVIITSTGIGGPSAAIALEELSLIGLKKAVRIGTCGGISAEVSGGDIVIPTAAIRMEGTSREYAPVEYPACADFDMVCALVRAAQNNKMKYHTGVIQSKDSFYGQHSPESMPVSYELLNKWDAWKRLGVLASEMETAALFTVAAVRRIKMGCVLHVMWNQVKSVPHTDGSDRTDLAIRTAVDALGLIIDSDRG